MDFDAHDALMGLIGGLMIGLAAAVYLLGLGRIAGISGIAAAVLKPSGGLRWQEDLAFLIGLVAAPFVIATLVGTPLIGVTGEPALLIAGGLLVGYGTRMGGGCTSGHGVCGMSRFSPRSIAATLAFMAVGIATASALRPLLGG